MLRRMRHSAGLLLALFVGHLSMVASGVVCVVPGMSRMSGAVAAGAVADGSMPEMAMAHAGPKSGASVSDSSHGSSSGQTPCSGPASGTCAATMPCVTALGASPSLTLASAVVARVDVGSRAVRVPASSNSAPEIPPPRA